MAEEKPAGDFVGFTVIGLIKELQRLNEEIGCDGNRTGSHPGKSTVDFRLEHSSQYMPGYLKIKEVIPNLRPGCGCWDGITFELVIDQDFAPDNLPDTEAYDDMKEKKERAEYLCRKMAKALRIISGKEKQEGKFKENIDIAIEAIKRYEESVK